MWYRHLPGVRNNGQAITMYDFSTSMIATMIFGFGGERFRKVEQIRNIVWNEKVEGLLERMSPLRGHKFPTGLTDTQDSSLLKDGVVDTFRSC